MNRHVYVPYTGISYMTQHGQPFERVVTCSSKSDPHRTIVRSPESPIEHHINRKIIAGMGGENPDRKYLCN